MIKATIIADSISPAGARLTTFELTYPRVIHSEFMTHRMFSRNASSSRAIPWTRMREWILDNPYVPIHWGKNQKGMQATEELSPADQRLARERWLHARDSAIAHADRLVEQGIHKQIVNRIVEPWAHINVVCSSTSFANFFALRIHRAAMPEIQALAVAMARAYRDRTPIPRHPGDQSAHVSHLPYVTDDERVAIKPGILVKVSAARCARVSFKTHDGKLPDIEDDLALYERLVGSAPVHASPTEHQAMPHWSSRRSGNFTGWLQHRKTIDGEAAPDDFDWQSRLVEWEGVDYLV